MIQTRDLTKTFRVHEKEPGLVGSIQALFKRKWVEKTALKNVNIKVGAGEILGLVGANGAGKTTLVKTLAGIIHPTSGEAEVLGFTPWQRDNRFRQQISLIMGQKAQLWWDLPAADCFLLLREIYRIPRPEFQKNLDYLTQALDVRSELKVQIRRLSLGERMKMELIAALLHQPKVVFLDEPTIGLDLTAQKAIRKFILEYRQAHKPAMILTSHYMEDIESLCERIAIIREGELVYDGSLSRVVNQFANHKVMSARLNPSKGSAPEPQSKPNLAWLTPELGELVEADHTFVRLRVPRDRVPQTAGHLLERLSVVDMNIEEPDIGTLIESLIRRREI